MLAVGSYRLSVISYRFLRPGGQARGYTSRTGKKLPEINQKLGPPKPIKPFSVVYGLSPIRF